ncbi:hypothetical protein AGIG_G7249 [Arapaima gigas]
MMSSNPPSIHCTAVQMYWHHAGSVQKRTRTLSDQAFAQSPPVVDLLTFNPPQNTTLVISRTNPEKKQHICLHLLSLPCIQAASLTGFLQVKLHRADSLPQPHGSTTGLSSAAPGQGTAMAPGAAVNPDPDLEDTPGQPAALASLGWLIDFRENPLTPQARS